MYFMPRSGRKLTYFAEGLGTLDVPLITRQVPFFAQRPFIHYYADVLRQDLKGRQIIVIPLLLPFL